MKNFKKKGFTLIELIVVIAIIAILMLILVPTMNGFVDQAKGEANIANAKAVYTAMKAQDTAAKTGMKGSDNALYTSINDSGICSNAGLHADFYGELLPAACTYTKNTTTGAIIVTWNNNTYPISESKTN